MWCAGFSVQHPALSVGTSDSFQIAISFTCGVQVSLFNTLRFPLVVLPKALRGTSG
jgi:hypothetical protein